MSAAKKGRVSLTWKTRLREDASNVQVQHSLVAVYGLLKRKISCPSGSSLEQICLRKTSKPSSNKTLGIIEALLPSKPCYISKVPATYAEKRRTNSATSFIPRNHLPSKLRYPVPRNKSSASSNISASWATAGSSTKQSLHQCNTSGSSPNGQHHERLNDFAGHQ